MLGVVKVGSEISASTGASGEQSKPAITHLSTGGYVVTWRAPSATSAWETKAQLFGTDGTKIGGVFSVFSSAIGAQYDPDVTGLAGGGFLATMWSGNGVFAQLFNADGSKLGGEFLVGGGGRGSFPSITALTDGGFVMTWQDVRPAVVAQIFDASGAQIGSQFTVHSGGSSPRTTDLANGGFVIAWQENSSTSGDGSGSSIKAQVFNASGARIGSEVLVNTQTAGNQTLPSLTGLANGNFVITWQDASKTLGDTSSNSIKAQLFSADGTKVGAEFLVNTQTFLDQRLPTVASLNNGGFVITWTDESQTLGDTSITGIKAQAFGADGSRLGSEFLVNTTTQGYQYDSGIASLGNDGFVVAWTDSIDGSNSTIKTQIFNWGSIPVITSNGGGYLASISLNENGSAVTKVVATDADAGASLVYSIAGGADAALFRIDASTGELALRSAANFEAPGDADRNNVYQVKVKVSDGALADWQEISVTVLNINEAPVITSSGGGASAAIAVAENGTAVSTVVASDADAGAALTYAITGGSDAALFTINAQTGALAFKASPDFEAPKDAGLNNVYDVLVRVSDGALADTQALAITVSNVANESLLGTSNADRLTGAGGDDALWGGGGSDTLIGNAGNDGLDGGTGSDSMDGGGGHDTYIVDDIGDRVIETAGNGSDTVRASISYTLGAAVENLTLTGTANLSGTGNDLFNTLVGNAGDNLLTGLGGNDTLSGGGGSDTLLGGLGKDMLTGGAGRDFFVFNTAPSMANLDTITDFNGSENDKIQLGKAIFGGFAQIGALTADQFHAASGATAAHDATDRIIYDTTSGNLYYDADGLGGAAAVQIAIMGAVNHPTLIYTDIQIIA